jgi:hypothetical protein
MFSITNDFLLCTCCNNMSILNTHMGTPGLQHLWMQHLLDVQEEYVAHPIAFSTGVN